MTSLNLSNVNRTYVYNTQQKPSAPKPNLIQQPKKTLSKKEKINLAVNIASIAIAAGIFIGSAIYKRGAKLADHIEFSPVKTIEEAKEFALKHLKIKKFELTDIESANHVLEGLVNYNNTISKNHRQMVKTVSAAPKKVQGYCSASMNGFKHLVFNEKHLQDILNGELPDPKGVIISDLVELTEKQKKLMERFTAGETFEGKEKIEFTRLLSSIYERDDYAIINDLLKLVFENDKGKQLMAERGITSANMLDFTHGHYAMDTLKEVAKEIGIKCTIPENGAFSTLYHEIGHAAHCSKLSTPRKFFYNLGNFLHPSEPWKAAQKFDKFENTAPIALNVSRYATTNPLEFVAEVYSGLCSGSTFPDEIMQIYKKYRGPVV